MLALEGNCCKTGNFQLGDKYRQMELSDVVKKISWVVNES
jgi:hypothetical protein